MMMNLRWKIVSSSFFVFIYDQHCTLFFVLFFLFCVRSWTSVRSKRFQTFGRSAAKELCPHCFLNPKQKKKCLFGFGAASCGSPFLPERCVSLAPKHPLKGTKAKETSGGARKQGSLFMRRQTTGVCRTEHSNIVKWQYGHWGCRIRIKESNQVPQNRSWVRN